MSTTEPGRESNPAVTASGERSFLTTDEVADLLRTSSETVRYWRNVGKGPVSFKVGRRVLYATEDVQQWVDDERQRQSSMTPVANDALHLSQAHRESVPVTVLVQAVNADDMNEWVEWPAGWPPPRVGDQIQTDTVWVSVENVTWMTEGYPDDKPAVLVLTGKAR